MTALYIALGVCAGVGPGYLWGKLAERRDGRQRADLEAHNRATATRERITDAITMSKAGGAADPTDWIGRLSKDSE